ncbi:MAG: hypothetical protein Q9218_000275 [Villophora microphyllina]
MKKLTRALPSSIAPGLQMFAAIAWMIVAFGCQGLQCHPAGPSSSSSPRIGPISISSGNGSTGNLGDTFTGLILRTDKGGGYNQFNGDSLGLIAITALKEGALLDFDERVLDYDFIDDLHSENPLWIVMTAEVHALSHVKTRRSTVMWAINAVVVDMLRTAYLRQLAFTVYYNEERLYTGHVSRKDHESPLETTTSESSTDTRTFSLPDSLNAIPANSTNVILTTSSALRDDPRYELWINYIESPRSTIGRFAVFESLMAFVLQLGQRGSGSITPRVGITLPRLHAWVFMKEVVPPPRGFDFQQYHAVAIAEAIARYCVGQSRYSEITLKFRVDGNLLATGCVTKAVEYRRWCGRMPMDDPPGNLARLEATS